MDIYESLRRFVIGRRAPTNGDALGVTVQVPAVYITLLVIGPPASCRSVVDRISLVRASTSAANRNLTIGADAPGTSRHCR
jgi:hypothetical protein